MKIRRYCRVIDVEKYLKNFFWRNFRKICSISLNIFGSYLRAFLQKVTNDVYKIELNMGFIVSLTRNSMCYSILETNPL